MWLTWYNAHDSQQFWPTASARTGIHLVIVAPSTPENMSGSKAPNTIHNTIDLEQGTLFGVWKDHDTTPKEKESDELVQRWCF